MAWGELLKVLATRNEHNKNMFSSRVRHSTRQQVDDVFRFFFPSSGSTSKSRGNLHSANDPIAAPFTNSKSGKIFWLWVQSDEKLDKLRHENVFVCNGWRWGKRKQLLNPTRLAAIKAKAICLKRKALIGSSIPKCILSKHLPFSCLKSHRTDPNHLRRVAIVAHIVRSLLLSPAIFTRFKLSVTKQTLLTVSHGKQLKCVFVSQLIDNKHTEIVARNPSSSTPSVRRKTVRKEEERHTKHHHEVVSQCKSGKIFDLSSEAKRKESLRRFEYSAPRGDLFEVRSLLWEPKN